MKAVYDVLASIVGEDFVSDRPEEIYIYSYDPGASEPRKPDYIVMPKTTEEVQRIVEFANKEKIPIVPWGAGLALTGLVLPVRGGIVVDMRRMDKIIEVSEKSRYAVIEAGVSEGALKSYLEQNHPTLRQSLPDAPPAATVAGNVLIHGSGNLSHMYGFHSGMINGLEVVLPTGEACKIGSCSISPYWFANEPLPDLTGLFTGWFGTTGIVTKLSIRLYPKPKRRAPMVFVVKDIELFPDIISKVSQLEMAEDFAMIAIEKLPDVFFNINKVKLSNFSEGIVRKMIEAKPLLLVMITGQSNKEIRFKKRCILKVFKHAYGKKTQYVVKYIKSGKLAKLFKSLIIEEPPFLAMAGDFRRGGGFEYVGSMIPTEKVTEAYKRGVEIAQKHGVEYTIGFRVIGRGHTTMFFYSYLFNRADEEEMQRVRETLYDTNRLAVDLGGLIWKAEHYGQKMMMEKMDPNTLELMKKIRKLMDPNGIMNPGNWEIQ